MTPVNYINFRLTDLKLNKKISTNHKENLDMFKNLMLFKFLIKNKFIEFSVFDYDSLPYLLSLFSGRGLFFL